MAQPIRLKAFLSARKPQFALLVIIFSPILKPNIFSYPKIVSFLIQGRHGWKGPQGLGLAWILQDRKRQHATDVAAAVGPCLPKIGCGSPVIMYKIQATIPKF